MSSSKQIIVAFDAYGTLLSTSSIADELASHFGKEKAAAIATEWRRLQLEYTWRLNSMGAFCICFSLHPTLHDEKKHVTKRLIFAN